MLAPRHSMKPIKTHRRVLIVNDDPAIQARMAEALVSSEFRVDCVASSTEARQSALADTPDALVVDATTSSVCGIDMCRDFGSDVQLAEIPILIVTDHDDCDSIDKAFDCGAYGVIPRPIQYAIVGRHVRFAIRASETARALRMSESRLAAAQRIASLGYWIWRPATDEFTVSAELRSVVGADKLDSLHALVELIHEDDRSGFRADIDRVVDEHSVIETTYRLGSTSESVRFVHQSLTVDAENADEFSLVGTVQDITQRQLAEDKIRYLAYYDVLTGLASRTYLYERIAEMIKSAMRRKEGFALLFLDLDGFKDINDTLGHAEGDKFLKIVAERLKNSLRDNDFLARFGGDEFCIVLDNVEQESDIGNVARRILANVKEDVELSGRTVQPRTSIGIAKFPDDGVDLRQLLRAADSAMYEAKAQGKHRFEYFDAAMTAEAERRFTIGQELQAAFRNGEFELYYQPQVSLSSGRVVAFECLARWNHPTRGVVTPNEFIGELERLGLIGDFGVWAINEACSQYTQWQIDAAEDFRVSVNIAASQFQGSELIEIVQAALRGHNVPANAIELEVKESALRHTEESAAALLELKRLGVHLAIDDFGSGNSSLGSLHQLPVDCLKIDRMYVRDLLSDPKNAALLGTIMALAHALGLRVIAEGVENADQIHVLGSLDCDLVQGFYFSKPLPASEVARLIGQRILPAASEVNGLEFGAFNNTSRETGPATLQ